MAGATVKFFDNRAKWDKLIKTATELSHHPIVAVGLPENKSPSSVIAYGAYNHFGVPGHIPARPFIAVAIDKNKEKIFNLKKILYGQLLEGKTDVRKALGILGTFAQDKVKEVISGPYFKETEPNKASTIAQKGSDQPLIDHGTLKNSIKYDVRLHGK